MYIQSEGGNTANTLFYNTRRNADAIEFSCKEKQKSWDAISLEYV